MVSLFPGILEVFFSFVNQWLIVTDINSHCQDQQEMGGLKLCTLFFLFLSGALLKMVGMWMMVWGYLLVCIRLLDT